MINEYNNIYEVLLDKILDLCYDAISEGEIDCYDAISVLDRAKVIILENHIRTVYNLKDKEDLEAEN